MINIKVSSINNGLVLSRNNSTNVLFFFFLMGLMMVVVGLSLTFIRSFKDRKLFYIIWVNRFYDPLCC